MPRAPFQVLVAPYRRSGTTLEVAVFHRADYDVWQFVSGGGELGETPDTAAMREAFEEAAIPLTAHYTALDSTGTIPACWFSAWPSWPKDILVLPEHAFAVEARDPIVISTEHLAFEWLDYEAAMRRLRFDSNKNALWELRERLWPGPRHKRPAYA